MQTHHLSAVPFMGALKGSSPAHESYESRMSSSSWVVGESISCTLHPDGVSMPGLSDVSSLRQMPVETVQRRKADAALDGLACGWPAHNEAEQHGKSMR